MNKIQLKTLLETIHAQWQLEDIHGQFFFLKYMELACDKSNEDTYILEDLYLLAEIMKKTEMTYLIETIEIHDLPSAQILDYLVAK